MRKMGISYNVKTGEYRTQWIRWSGWYWWVESTLGV